MASPKFVTAVSRCDVVDGWRERRHEGGILIDVATDRIVTEDLSMPHSPRVNAGTLWVLDSGRGYLCRQSLIFDGQGRRQLPGGSGSQ